MTDANQQVVAAYRYDGFGVLKAKSGTLVQPYQFSTKPYYSGFCGNYFGFRFYLAVLGRWMTRDPLGEEGGMNLYGFVGNSAMNLVDYWGLDSNAYPPVPVPGGDPNNGWKWNPNPQNSRGGSWGPKRPIKGQSQPSASWDKEGHWDVDDGKGGRQRYDDKGNPMTPEEAHGGKTCEAADYMPNIPPFAPPVFDNRYSTTVSPTVAPSLAGEIAGAIIIIILIPGPNPI